MGASVIWDWNGTLLNDVDVCVAAMNRLLGRRGLARLSLARYREVFTFPVQLYYERVGFDFRGESFADVAVEYHDAYEELVHGAELHSDALESLEAFRVRGVGQAVLSALEETRLQNELASRALDGYFSHVFGLPDLHARSKADRGRELLRAVGTHGRQWMIGDTIHDAEVAREIGVRCVLVGCGHHGADQLRAGGVPVFSGLTKAVSYVQEMVAQEENHADQRGRDGQ